MTPTNEDLLALADRADSWNRCYPGNLNVELLVADLSAALRVLVAERQKPQAVKVKPLVWVETFEDRGDGTSEHNGGYESASVLGFYEIGMGFGSDSYYWSISDPNCNEVGSFEDPTYAKSAAQADYEARILAALDVSETPESDRQTDLLSATERQAIRDKALDDAAKAASDRAAYWWDEATAADDTGRKKLSLSYEAKALACIELAAAIRVLKGKPE